MPEVEFTRRAVLPGAVPALAQEVGVPEDLVTHGHDFVEGVVVLRGTAIHTSGPASASLSTGSALVLRPGQRHGYRQVRDLVLVNLYVGAELLRHELAWLGADARVGALLGTAPGGTPPPSCAVRRLTPQGLDRCRAGLERLGPRGASRRVARIAALLDVLDALACAEVAAEVPGHEPNGAGPGWERVDHVRRLLAEDLRAPWTVELLARRVHVTPSYLNELCTRHAGAPPIRLLARLRAERAADLLRTTDLTVTRIAAEVGWADPNLFARRFKAHFGLAPGAYRRAVHGDVPASSRPAVEARP